MAALDGPGDLKINGREVTAEQLSKVIRPGMSQSTVEVAYGANTVTFNDKGGSLEMIFNGATTHVGKGAVELHLSSMAACIGDACLMWPPPPPPKKESDEQFLKRVEGAHPWVLAAFTSTERTGSPA